MARLKKLLKKTAVVLVILLLAYLALYTIVSLVYRAKIDKEIARIESEGGSVDLADFIPKAPPQSRNGARFYRAATLAMHGRRFRGQREETPDTEALKRLVDYLEGKEPWPADDETILRGLLAKNAHVLGLLEQADLFEDVVFETNWEAGYNVLLLHLGELRNLSHLLALRSTFALRDGKTGEAVSAVRAMLRLRRALDREPMLISKLVACVLDRLACDLLQTEFKGRDFAENDGLDAILEELQGREAANRTTVVIEGERAISVTTVFDRKRPIDISLLVAMSGWNTAHFSQKLAALVLKTTPLLLIDEYAYLRTMEAYIENSKVEFPEALDLEDEGGWFRDSSSERYVPRYCVLTRSLTPAMTRLRETEALTNALTALARAGIALEIHRGEKGSYPGDLAELAPGILDGVPVDPYTGNAVLYRREGEDYLLYSVGLDRTDDGGLPKKHLHDRRERGDIVWGR